MNMGKGVTCTGGEPMCVSINNADWIKIRDAYPPMGEIVEVIIPKGNAFSNLNREFLAMVRVENELLWITPDLTHEALKYLKVKYWRYIHPDPYGKKPYVRVKVFMNGMFSPHIYYKRVVSI